MMHAKQTEKELKQSERMQDMMEWSENSTGGGRHMTKCS